jgi:hypothetical protein
VFGYSSEDAARIFKIKKWPSCGGTGPNAQIGSFIGDKLHLSCPDGHGSYVAGVSSDQEVLGYYTFENEPTRYIKPVSLPGVEYAFVSCDSDKTAGFDEVVYRNIIDDAALARARATLNGAEPIHIVMLVVDSISRRSLYRSLPRTVEALEELEQVTDFMIHNVMGEFSSDSFMPSFLGDVEWGRIHGEIPDDKYEDVGIWTRMKEQGFVTFIGSDDCGNDFAAFLGRRPGFDHKMATFWCAAERYYNFRNNARTQRCIGRENAHTYMLDYALEFAENYKDVSRFTYIHPNTAHEGSGTVVTSLD